MNRIILDCKSLENGKEKVIEKLGFTVKVFHNKNDDICVNRISIEHIDMNIELLPSKGLTVNEAFFRGQPYFWEPPLDGLPNPDNFNPFEKMYIDGILTEGFSWLKQFTGGVEMLGLENWGMPETEEATGFSLPMHGTVSMIPVKSVNIDITEDSAEISGTFEVRNTREIEKLPWYKNGEVIFEVTKRIIIKPDSARIILKDTITNKSVEARIANWGYHVQMRAFEGAEYLIPSKKMKRIGESTAANNHEIWYNSKGENVRVQVMNRHTVLKVIDELAGEKSGIRTLLKYPDGHAIMAVIPACPWIASWMSSGGAGSREWCLVDASGKKGTSIMKKDYSGIGPEFGSKDLFGGEDEEIQYKQDVLEPMQSTETFIVFEMPEPAQAKIFEEEINYYIKDRKFG
ncbi:MAG: DUF4432 family protein [Clostridia bacterium]|jgi:hypothetical protein